MPQSIPEGLTADHVHRALADLDSGLAHPFGLPTGYELVHKGKRYPPKAVNGLAIKHLTGKDCGPKDFKGGQAQGQANSALRKLGFDIAEKDFTTGTQTECQGVFVTSRGYSLPTSQEEMAHQLWFNMWQRQRWPFKEVE